MKKYIPYPTRDAIKNYFPLPNEIFDFGLHSTAIAIYAYLMLLENRDDFTCFPAYKTIANAIGVGSKTTVAKYVRELEDKERCTQARTSRKQSPAEQGVEKHGQGAPKSTFWVNQVHLQSIFSDVPTLCGVLKVSVAISETLWYVFVLKKGGAHMAKRRASGEGLLHRRGKRWVARIVIGHAKDGKPIFHHISGKTQKEAKMKLHQALDDYRDVELTEDSRITLKEWLERWMNDYMSVSIRESTLKGYQAYIKNYIVPHLGDKRIDKLTTHAKDQIAEDRSIDSFIAGFRLAWRLSNELNMYEKTRPMLTPRERVTGMDAFIASEE